MDDATRQNLIAAACQIRNNAYAPYSQFRVGAAIACPDGEIVTGCNVENASYGLSICAERAAIAAAIAQGKSNWQAMAVATDGGHAPCGACRQVIAEFAPELPILLVDAARFSAGDASAVTATNVAALLPSAFELQRPQNH